MFEWEYNLVEVKRPALTILILIFSLAIFVGSLVSGCSSGGGGGSAVPTPRPSSTATVAPSASPVASPSATARPASSPTPAPSITTYTISGQLTGTIDSGIPIILVLSSHQIVTDVLASMEVSPTTQPIPYSITYTSSANSLTVYLMALQSQDDGTPISFGGYGGITIEGESIKILGPITLNRTSPAATDKHIVMNGFGASSGLGALNISPSSGTIDAANVTVTISCDNAVTIKYTTIESVDPLVNGIPYTGPVTLETSGIIKAAATGEGSGVTAEARYDLYWWSSMGVNGPAGNTYAFLYDSGNNVLNASGYFGVASWDASSPSPTWKNIGDLSIWTKSMVTAEGVLYAGISGNVSSLDAGTWHSLGTAFDLVNSLLYSNHTLYAGGDFGVSTWDAVGGTWESLGAYPGTVNAMLDKNGTIYAGGDFGVATWDAVGGTWEGLGVSPGTVYALINMNGTICAGGSFGVDKLNGTAWTTYGSSNNIGETVLSLANVNGELCAGTQGANVLLSNGIYWREISQGFNGEIFCLSYDNVHNILYAGGAFRDNPAFPVKYVAKLSKL